MLFSSPVFLFLFLPVSLALHFLIGHKFRNLFLLIASLLFYVWGEGTYVVMMVSIIAVNYALGRWIEGRTGERSVKGAVAVAVIINVGLLIAFKYSNFLVNQVNSALLPLRITPLDLKPVHLPLGISFFTFHALSYVIDISRGQVRAGKPLDFAVYMTFFPHAIAGPIVRYGDIAEQIRRRVITTAGFAEGIRRFILGLAKKVLVANTVAMTADAIFTLPQGELTAGLAWLGLVCYTLQIYFDFSGYSDMAIGLAKLFGITFLENFDYPYAARSVTEFWRRWHISLSTWFRDYLYIPLGGNRSGAARTCFNLVTVFFLCGLWHGASWTFAAWGLYHGAFLIIERTRIGRVVELLWSPGKHLYTLLVVSLGWVLFRADSLSHSLAFVSAMVGLGHASGLVHHTGLYLDNQLALALLAGVIGSAPVLPWLIQIRGEKLDLVTGRFGIVLRNGLALAELTSLSLLLLTSAMLLAAGTYNPFIYFRF